MFAKSTVAFATLALFLQGAYAAECTRKYTVKAGDYCDTISAANKASTYQLGSLNAGVIDERCHNLVPGQEICLGTAEVDCQDTIVVIPGHSCNAIWEATGADKDAFFVNNPQVKKDCSNIYVDEVLCVAKDGKLTPPPKPDVPIHTGPPPSEAVPPVPVNVAPTPAPESDRTPTPPAVAPEDEECEDEYEEIEVVEGETDEDLPFCDELPGYEHKA